jgi:RHS repeat-associated protein
VVAAGGAASAPLVGTRTWRVNGQLISQKRGATTSYYLPDAQGSTRALTTPAAAITDTYRYSAFGDIETQTGTTLKSYLYTGQQFDSSTGLYSLRARYYDAAVGRFLSRDMWAIDRQNPIELNRYVYAAGNPVRYSDPRGHSALGEWGSNVWNSLTTQQQRTVVGAVTGGAVGGILAGLNYVFATAEQCGPEMADFFRRVNPAIYIGGATLLGAAAGAVMANLPLPTVAQQALALTSMSIATFDLLFHFNEGSNACRYLNWLASWVGAAGAIGGGTSNIIAGGGQMALQIATASMMEIIIAGAATAETLLTGLLNSGVITLVSTGGNDNDTEAGSRPQPPQPGETAGYANRHPGRPEGNETGIYEYQRIDRNGRWYVGSARRESLAARLEAEKRLGWFEDWDSIVWTEISEDFDSGRAIDSAERIRIEQVARSVGGRANMANTPTSNPIRLPNLQSWWNSRGGWRASSGWPNWLYPPSDLFNP